LSLPFISYGGSNLIVLLAGVGLLINIGRQAADSQHARSPLDGGGASSRLS